MGYEGTGGRERMDEKELGFGVAVGKVGWMCWEEEESWREHCMRFDNSASVRCARCASMAFVTDSWLLKSVSADPGFLATSLGRNVSPGSPESL